MRTYEGTLIPTLRRDEQYENTKVELAERKRVVFEHARLHVEQYGERGIVTFRKHLAWYFKTNKIGIEIPGIKEWRVKAVRVSSLVELEELLKEI